MLRGDGSTGDGLKISRFRFEFCAVYREVTGKPIGDLHESVRRFYTRTLADRVAPPRPPWKGSVYEAFNGPAPRLDRWRE